MSVGASAGGFRETRWSLVLRARGAPSADSRKALGELCQDYRAPLLAFARHFEADRDRAEDLLQSFLARVVEKNVLGEVDRARGRFRSFLRTALHHHAMNLRDAAHAQKRGGGFRFVEADAETLASADPSVERIHDRLWVRALIDRTLARLATEQRSEGDPRFVALRDRMTDDHEETSLKLIAGQLGMSEISVRVRLHDLRARFREIFRAEVAATVARPEDVDAEIRDLLAAFGDGA